MIARALAKDRAERPGSIDEMARVLDQVAREAPWGEAEARAWWEAHPEARGAPALR
jgi:hypothetical protein